MSEKDKKAMPKTVLAGGVTNSIGLVINSSNPLSSLNGGTGISNSHNITLGGDISTGGTLNTASSFTTAGANPLTLTTTASTNVTLPVNGTLVNTAVSTLSNLSSIGTITVGTWNGSIIGPNYGGTGVANGTSTITLSNNLITTGGFSLTFNTIGTTNVTVPTSGTLATVGDAGVNIINVTATSAAMIDNAAINIYVVNNSSLVTLTLPTTSAMGHVFKILGVGAGGWTIAQNSGQSIVIQNNGSVINTTVGTGGSISSNLDIDCFEFFTSVANTTFTAVSAGSLSYV